MTDLHQKFAILCEFEDHVIVKFTSARLPFVVATTLWATAVAGNPHVALVVDSDSVIGIRPIVPWARTTPMPDEVAVPIELKDRWSRSTAHCLGRICRGVQFCGFE